MRRVVALVLLLAGSDACSGEDGSSRRSPTAPSAVQVQHSLPAEAPAGLAGPSAVDFPARDETLRFRQALENEYRDYLRRNVTSTFVDMEGTIVWTQEYLRYRVNLCSHADAVTRVMNQIDGLGIAPVCGTTATASFPPRNEPFDFMLQLEQKYQNGLRRSPSQTYVDVEGNIVWTQEYLRYRAGACTPSASHAHVLAQIEGRGVQPICSTVGPGIQGTWDGVYQRGGTFVLWVGANDARYTGSNQDITDYPTGVSNTGSTYTFDLYFGDTGIQLVAFWDGAHTMQGTTRGMGRGNFTMVRRR